MSDGNISRRDFLKRVGVGGAAATAAWLIDGRTAPIYASEGVTGPQWGVLIDLERCSGCNSCALACKQSNGLPQPDVVPDELNSDTYTFVDERWVTAADGQIRRRFVKRQCMHCLNAACVSACPAAAMHKSPAGPVIYRAYRCLGCRYCEAACPFTVPRFDWDNPINPLINKCWLCYDRLENDQQPACVAACPTGALQFGQREELLVRAHARIATNPGRYINHVFGESEVGGTSMLYLSAIPFEQLGFPANLSLTAPPEETLKVISKLPLVLVGVAALMTGTAAYTHRKSAGSGQETEEPPQASTSQTSDEQEA